MSSVEGQKPLAKRRLIATLPPPSFFGGINFQYALDHIAALRGLGATVYVFDTEAVYKHDVARIRAQVSDVLAFGADAVIGTPHAGYLLSGGMITNPSGGSRRNIFLDDLELPAVFLWDHALTQAARYCLDPWPEHPWQSQPGAIDSLKRIFRNPNFIHLFPDSGHARALEEFGIRPSSKAAIYVPTVATQFVRHDLRSQVSNKYVDDVAFFGNLYLARSQTLAYSSNRRIVELRRQARAACASDWCLPAFHAYADAIAALDSEERSSLALDPDQSFFWRFLFDEMSTVMNGEHRLSVLQSCGRRVSFYGNFADPGSNALLADKCGVRGALPFDQTLVEAYANTRVVIDVANAPFISGFSPKLFECFAAGGFGLTNPRPDLVHALGSIANEIFYRDAVELADKVENFIVNERRRIELATEIGSIVRREYTAEALFAKILPAALDRLAPQPKAWKLSRPLQRAKKYLRVRARQWLQ